MTYVEYVDVFNIHLISACLTVKYIIDFDNLLTSGFPNIPEYMVTGIIQEVTAFYYDDKMTAAEVSHDWMREYIKDNQKEWETFFQRCLNYKPVFKAETENFNKRSNKTEGRLMTLFCAVLFFHVVFIYVYFDKNDSTVDSCMFVSETSINL